MAAEFYRRREARPPGRRRIFGAHATHLRAQLLRCSLTQFSNALAPLLGVRWGPRGAATGGCPWIAESLAAVPATDPQDPVV